MWVFLSGSFLSIVDPDPRAATRRRRSDKLLVRARIRGDIERAFPDAEATETPGRDYRFRALISRYAVAKRIADAVHDIDYHNFKSSVVDRERHDAYLGVWSVTKRWQERYAPRVLIKTEPSMEGYRLTFTPPAPKGQSTGKPSAKTRKRRKS